DAALRPDVGGDALERHHRDGAGVLGDLRLLGVDDVHDHAALEHLGEAALDAHRPELGCAVLAAHRTSGYRTVESLHRGELDGAERPRFREDAAAMTRRPSS